MAALEAVREELETALGGDENWRALHGTGGSSGDADPDRRDRDARLVRSLEANPLYLAWMNVCEAIDALRDADHTDEASQIRVAPSEDETRAIELPEDIRARIRVDAAGEAASGRPEPSTNDAELPGEQTGKGTLGRKLATIPTLDPVEAPASAKAEPVSAVVRTKPAGDLPPLRIEPAEAKVSFVRRQAPAVAAKSPAGPDAPAAAGGDAFVPAAAATEEAEVAIVNTPVRRFLKALSGD
jgi:hypothetical protein